MSNLVCGKWKKICLFASCATKLVLGSKTFSITLRTSTVRGTISAKCVPKSSNLETRCRSIATGTTKKAFPLFKSWAHFLSPFRGEFLGENKLVLLNCSELQADNSCCVGRQNVFVTLCSFREHGQCQCLHSESGSKFVPMSEV